MMRCSHAIFHHCKMQRPRDSNAIAALCVTIYHRISSLFSKQPDISKVSSIEQIENNKIYKPMITYFVDVSIYIYILCIFCVQHVYKYLYAYHNMICVQLFVHIYVY